MKISLSLVALAFIVFAAYPRSAYSQLIVPDQQYRCPKSNPACPKSAKWPAFESFGNASINFVEVRDSGALWDGYQLDEALERIAAARDGGRQRPLVFVYIHGWQNNADELPNDLGQKDCVKLHGDVAKFRTCGVARLAEVAGTRPVVGIYLAWRGLSSSIEPFKHVFSYWPRRNKARLVGGEGMFGAVDAIVKKVGEHRDDYVLVMVGHSFGSRVLEYAAEAVDTGRARCGFMAQFRAQFSSNERAMKCAAVAAIDKSRPVATRPPVDLFVYVNAATSHRMTYQALDDWQEICDAAPQNPVCPAAPMYLATTSRTDGATTFLLPVANTIAPAFKADRLHLISAANTFYIHTHHDPKAQDGMDCPPLPDELSFCFKGPKNDTEQNGTEVMYFVRAYPGLDQKRFWIFNTGHRLIRNHGDVWNKRLFNLVMAVVERNRPGTLPAAPIPSAAVTP